MGSRLRAETRQLHTQVERSAFMATLLRGRLNQSDYCLLLRNLHPIYLQLESALPQHAMLAPLLLPSLPRAAALEQDLAALHGPTWPTDIEVIPCARAYVQHLDALSQAQPLLLAAHAYVRYLGDLSGGQLLRGIVARSLQLPDGETHRGTAFYEFGPPQAVRTLAETFRARLDAVATSDAAIESIVAEALCAFEMHGQLFDELADSRGLQHAKP